ncbi:hypothetical protein [Arthrobacter sp. zg-Y1110]|uniref:hypothetical protein n=1 Tax=Arthrobacter sp. zg-Y1110 TaxID=2886932 RepID=UPI001D135450|nr:hypothetical protein [Arthrobacter sp. zg-Y1110]MCC3292407.1 hypothetical protein [Arthrobacter sp. zg-Y1110]UWX87157.1 hypothetical protein N2K99_17770 [Arthrobacter sp. zg-Y1110]
MSENAAPTPSPMSQKQEDFLLLLERRVWGSREAPQRLAEFRQSCGGSPTTAQASAEIKKLQGLEASRPKPAGRRRTDAPEGCYGVYKDGSIVLVKLSKPTEGKWAGYNFLTTVPIIPEQEPEPVRGEEARLILEEIQAEPSASATEFGRITRHCPFCRRKLSVAYLQAGVGIHSECRAKVEL